MDKQTFAWNTACRIAEMMSNEGEEVKPEDVIVTIETDDRNTWEPVIEYKQHGFTFRGKWHDGEGINDIRWQEIQQC